MILSIDAGTQSVRAALVDEKGELHHLVKTTLPPYSSPKPGWAEIDPEAYFDALAGTVKKVMAAHGGAVDAVTLTTQRTTVVNVDREGKPLRPGILWLDQRRADASKVLPRVLNPALAAVGLKSFLEWVVQYSRSNWIREHEPEVWNKTHKFLFLSGYLGMRLTGELRDSAGSVVGPIPFDVKKLDWAGRLDPKWLLFPMEREKLPELVKPTELLGHVTQKAAEATGIPVGTPVIAAAADKACDILGAGCLTPERACVSFGTTATINTQNERYVELRPLHPPYPSAIPGQYYSEVPVLRGLWMVTWFKEEFGLQERLQASERNVAPEELLEKLLHDVPPGSLGLMCLPHWFAGPERASFTRGAVVGFGEVHTRAHLYRAILEGLVYALREGGEKTEKANRVPITSVRATGGGAKSDSILQITADVFDLPVERPHTHETSVVGAAMDASVGLRMFTDFASAARAMTRVDRVFEPIPANVEIYGDLYDRVYRRMYETLLPLYADLRDITGYP